MPLIHYYGTPNYNEQPLTGVQRLWTTGMQQDVSASVATALIAANVGFALETESNKEAVVYATDSSNRVTGLLMPDGVTIYPGVVVLGQQNTTANAPADTNENTLYSLTIPGGLMGPNDSVEAIARFSCTNSANLKTGKIKFGTMTIYTQTATTAGGFVVSGLVSNRNSVSAQVGGASSSVGSNTPNTGAINTANSVVLAVTGQLALGTESLALESVTVKLIRAA